MELADFIRLGQQQPVLRFLVISGYAVAAHGHTRATFDVDFLVRRAERDDWSTTPSSVSCKIREVNATDPELRFPEGDGFRALPPLVPLAQMIRRIHRLRRLFPAGLRRSDERWQAKTAVEFTL